MSVVNKSSEDAARNTLPVSPVRPLGEVRADRLGRQGSERERQPQSCCGIPQEASGILDDGSAQDRCKDALGI
jgi:hypothetical protein